MWGQIINALLGLWLMATPGILGFEKLIADNNHITGPVIATFAITAIFDCTRPVRKFNILPGIWLLAAPWVLGYDNTTAIVNDMLVGALVIGFSFVKGHVDEKFGGGWSGLWEENSLHEREAKNR